ncbi:MAG: hypothetical protein AB2448_07995 [Moorella sp. (in: firmicutes)]
MNNGQRRRWAAHNEHAPGEVGLAVGLGLDMDQDAAVFAFDVYFRQDIHVVLVAGGNIGYNFLGDHSSWQN